MHFLQSFNTHVLQPQFNGLTPNATDLAFQKINLIVLWFLLLPPPPLSTTYLEFPTVYQISFSLYLTSQIKRLRDFIPRKCRAGKF